MRAKSLPVLLALALGALSPGTTQAQDVWSTFNGDLAAQKYSPLTQITPENVNQLKVAWRTHTGDVSQGGAPPAGMHMKPDANGKIPNIPATVWLRAMVP